MSVAVESAIRQIAIKEMYVGAKCLTRHCRFFHLHHLVLIFFDTHEHLCVFITEVLLFGMLLFEMVFLSIP
jgi:hypothetical protein